MREDDGFFDEEVAATYDAATSGQYDQSVIDCVVDVLADLAGDGSALEFGIGTGRIAIPLARRGVEVHGIDMSEAMVARLRAKPDGANLGVTIGDFADTRVPGAFAVTYLVFNTIGNLTTQDAQVACFLNAAEHLQPGGSFVIENSIPALRQLPPGQRAVPFDVGEQFWAYDLYDCATQSLTSNYVDEIEGSARFRSMPFRYVWPSELDLMARIAGMFLVERWQDWDHTSFTHESTRHVSIWQKPL